jgi:hypothetical protein
MLSKPKEHRAWRPRMSSDVEFNPFVHISDSSHESFDRGALEETDELRHEPDEAEPIKKPVD